MGERAGRGAGAREDGAGENQPRLVWRGGISCGGEGRGCRAVVVGVGVGVGIGEGVDSGAGSDTGTGLDSLGVASTVGSDETISFANACGSETSFITSSNDTTFAAFSFPLDLPSEPNQDELLTERFGGAVSVSSFGLGNGISTVVIGGSTVTSAAVLDEIAG